VPHKVKFADPIPLNLVGELDAGVPILHPWRVFLSVLPVDDGYIGVVREFKIPRSANETHLFALRLNSRGAPIGDPVNLGTGEDPRLFIHNGRFFALSWQPRYSNGIADINQFVVDLQTGSRISLSHDLNYGGKNWMPVMGHSSLWIIRSIVPLVILEADPATGRCTTVLSWGDEEITEFRGGGALPVHHFTPRRLRRNPRRRVARKVESLGRGPNQLLGGSPRLLQDRQTLGGRSTRRTRNLPCRLIVKGCQSQSWRVRCSAAEGELESRNARRRTAPDGDPRADGIAPQFSPGPANSSNFRP
jgi:hypothetical protein